MDYMNVLMELAGKAGIAGYEKEVARFISVLFQPLCDEVIIDRFYNVIGIKKGMADHGKKVLITAHMDEIGFIVKSIDDKGFLKLAAVGGVDNKILPALEVVVHGKNTLTAVIGAKPPHLMTSEDARKAVKLDDLSIDTGLDANEVRELVSIGDMVTLKSKPVQLGSGRMSGKTMDNRCSIVAMLAAIEELGRLKHENDIYFAATTQEEFELAGATAAVYNIDPAAAVVIDACHGDMPDVSKDDTCSLGKGPAIGIGPTLDREYTRYMINMAKEYNMPYQIDVEPGDTGTEAWATQVSRSGIPTLLLSIPVRYMHTAVETVDLKDIINAGRLTARFAAGLSV